MLQTLRTIKRVCSKIRRVSFLTLLVIATCNLLAIFCVGFVNSLVKSETKTAVFASGWHRDNGWPTQLNALAIVFGAYVPITLRQNLRGFHTDWYLDPSAWEVIEKMADPAYENIVLIGHGTRESFATKDGGINSLWVSMMGIHKKKGELIQHTCGSSFWPIISLRNALLEDPDKGYYFNHNVDIFENGLRAYLEFGREVLRRIRSETNTPKTSFWGCLTLELLDNFDRRRLFGEVRIAYSSRNDRKVGASFIC